MSSLALTRRLSARVMAVAVGASLLLTAVFVESASAHGSAIDPPSRNYGCWDRWGSDFQNPQMATQDPMCWQAWQANSNAMWNWNGLYIDGVNNNHQAAIPDGQLCSAGRTEGARYAAMDAVGAWQAAPVNNNFSVTVHDMALHGADYHLIYVTRQGYNALTDPLRWADLELVSQTGVVPPGSGTPSNDPVLNGVSVTLNASAPGRTGRHIIYTIWRASHSDQTYYFCSDVIFPGGGGPSPTPTQSPTPSPTPTSSPSPTPTSSPSPTPTSSPPPGTGSCSASYTKAGEWGGGFQADVTVTAGSASISGWTVQLAFPNGQTVSSIWNASLGGSGSTVTASNMPYNGSLGADQSAMFGFLGSWNGVTNNPPTLTCTAS